MQALVYEGPNKVRVRQRPDPAIEHAEDVVLKVTRSAVCGSDLHLFHGFVPDTRVGCTFGHEFAGVVEDVGHGVSSLKVGDRVVVPFNISCGACFYCERRLYAACENSNPNSDLMSGVYGYSHTTGGYDGGQAEYVRVPFADVGPMKIPDDMSEEDVLFLSDIFPTGYQGAEMAGLEPGDSVVIFGAGPVGLFAAKSAWLLGAGRVVVVDRVAYRLDFARRWAHVETVDASQVDDVVPHLKEMFDGRGPDACIDAVGMEAEGSAMHTLLGVKAMLEAGSAAVLSQCFDVVRKGGTVSVVGVYGPPFNILPIGTAMNKNLTLRLGQCNVRRYMPHLLEHVRSGRVDAKGIISHRFPLSQAPEAYRLFEQKLDDCIKCVLMPEVHA